MKNFKSLLSVILVVMMVATMLVPSFASETETTATPYVSSNGATMTIHNLYDIKDLWIAEGEYTTYREVKEAGYLFSATAKKLGSNTDFSYVVTHGGMHTVIVRYNDGTAVALHHTIEVIDPEFSVNGLQVTVSNLDDVRMIRTAYGSHSSVKSIKATAGFRNFSNKTEIKGRDPYTIQYREEGLVTIVVEYNHGYQVFQEIEIVKNTPLVEQVGNTVVFSNLDNLVMVRYAKGVYSTASEIKAAGSTVLKSGAIVDGSITVTDLEPGTYTFCVQYNDESYNYYVITIEEEPVIGTYDNPYLIYVDGTRLAVTIPAGSEAYVKADNSANSVLTVGYATSENYMIYYCRQPYYPDTTTGNNDTSFTMNADVDFFAITNTGDEDIVIYMTLAAGEASDTTGTMDDPEEITLSKNMFGAVGASVDKTFEAASEGYFYYVTAPANGQLTFSMMGAVDAEYNNIGWTYNINNETAPAYGDYHWSDDATPVYDETWGVSAGDKLVIFVNTYDPANMWTAPAGTVSFQLTFEAEGSANNPYIIDAGAYIVDIAAGTDGTYYTYTAPSAGSVDVIMYSDSWQYVVNNLTSGYYGDLLTSSDEEVVPCTTIEVAEGDTITVMVNTYDPDDSWNAPAGQISWELCFYSSGAVEEPDVEPELGSYELPYDLYVDGTRLAITVEAGAEAYVKVDEDNASIVTVGYASSASYMLVYCRQTYNPAEDGTATLTMVEGADTFCVYNSSEEAITLYMTLAAGEVVDNTGTMDNPEEITLAANMFGGVGASVDKVFEAATEGYYYYVTAPSDGTIIFSMMGAVDAEYNNIGWTYNINNETAPAYGDYHWSDDATPVYDEAWTVSAGDKLVIYVNTYDPANMWTAPAGTLSFQLSFEAVGSANNPEEVTLSTNMFGELGASLSYTGEAGNSGYYYTITAPEAGRVTVSQVAAVDAEYNAIGWQFSLTSDDAGYYGDAYYSDNDPVVNYDSVSLEAGESVTVFLSAYDGSWTAPAGTVSATVIFDAVGTVNNPAGIAGDGVYTAEIEEGSNGAYYVWTANTAGTVTIAIDTANTTTGWNYSIENKTGGYYGDLHYSDDETVVAYETITVSAGDIITFFVNSYDASSWSAPAGTIAWAFNFTGETAYTITLDANGGVLNAPTTYGCNANESYFSIFGGYYPVPTLEGYVFDGWYNEKYNFTLTAGDIASGTYVVAESNDFVAIWTEA